MRIGRNIINNDGDLLIIEEFGCAQVGADVCMFCPTGEDTPSSSNRFGGGVAWNELGRAF